MPTFRLTPLQIDGSRRFSELRVAAGDEALAIQLPLIDGITYSLLPNAFASVSVAGDQFEIHQRSALASLIDRCRQILVLKRRRILRFGAFTIVAHGPKAARKSFTSIVKRLRNTGYPLNGATVRQFPEIVLGWADSKAMAMQSASVPIANTTPLIAVVVHIYYRDVWPEIAAVLRRVGRPFDLIVTTVADRDDLFFDVCSAFPDADVRVVANRGRDVRPFLSLLEEGRLDRYSYVCKIHGKKSHDGGRNAIVGDIWRNQLLFDLLGAPGIVGTVIGRFETDARLGMVGSQAYRFPNRVCGEKASWGANRELVLRLTRGLGQADYNLDFFGGTMFWVRPSALFPLRKLGLASKFPEEQGQTDGALEHAVERLFTASAFAAGFTIQSLSGAGSEF